MENYFDNQLDSIQKPVSESEVRAFFSGVYAYMFLGLAVSGLTSWYFASSGLFFEWFFTGESISPLFYVVAFSPLAFVFLIQAKYRSFSKGTLILLFLIFSVLMGMSFSSIFFAYNLGTIFLTFIVTAGAFGGMAILGYTTSTDLSKIGSLLYMLFIGIFIASIANFFFKSGMLSYIVSLIGVVVFTGLTAWEMQKLRGIATEPSITEEEKQKLSLLGGMTLYILFINLFLSILRLMGGRD